MLAKYENRLLELPTRVWAGTYRNLQNLPHWHFECEVIYVDNGSAIVSINNRSLYLTAGQSVFCNSEDIHYIRGAQDSIISVIIFDASIAKGILDRYRLSDVQIKSNQRVDEYVSGIVNELISGDSFFEMKADSFVKDLIANIFRTEDIVPISEPRSQGTIERFKNLLRDMDERIASYTFDNAAEFMGQSRSYFSKSFHEISGMTFSKYLNVLRIEKAMAMIGNSACTQSIAEIASLCGFGTVRNFNRVFKLITGTNPKSIHYGQVPNLRDLRHVMDTYDPTLGTSELISPT